MCNETGIGGGPDGDLTGGHHQGIRSLIRSLFRVWSQECPVVQAAELEKPFFLSNLFNIGSDLPPPPPLLEEAFFVVQTTRTSGQEIYLKENSILTIEVPAHEAQTFFPFGEKSVLVWLVDVVGIPPQNSLKPPRGMRSTTLGCLQSQHRLIFSLLPVRILAIT